MKDVGRCRLKGESVQRTNLCSVVGTVSDARYLLCMNPLEQRFSCSNFHVPLLALASRSFSCGIAYL
jgi:hypothetical protein